MKNNNSISKMIWGLVLGCSLFVALFSLTINLFNDSYAIEVPANTEFPNSTFTTNYSSGNTTNLFATAVGSNTNFVGKTFNFAVTEDYKLSDNTKPLYNLSKNYYAATAAEQFEINDNTPKNITDTGLLYILSHGYNVSNTTNTVFAGNTYGGVTDNSIKQYITQIAVWLYMYENKAKFADTYCMDMGSTGLNACDFYVEGSTTLISSIDLRTLITQAAEVEGYDYLNYVIKLVDDATSYTETNIGMTTIDEDSIQYIINNEENYLITEEITPTPSGNNENYLNYSLNLTDPNGYGAYLTDADGNKLTNTNNLSGSFKIYVPLSTDISTMDLSSISVSVTGKFVKLTALSYSVTNSPDGLVNGVTGGKYQRFSDVALGYAPTETSEITLSLRNITKISKVDAADSSELPGATLVIKNQVDQSVVEEWVSTTTPKYFFLENGSYTLCETIAPEGYSLNTECIDFEVDGTKVVSVQMKNEVEIPVPDTAANATKFIYIIGAMIVIFGLGLMGVVLFKNNKHQL